MPKFLLIYHGKPDIQSPEDGARHMEAWNAWNAGMGAAVVDPGLPVGPSKTITPDGVEDHGGANPASGMTVLQADTMDDAIVLAKEGGHCQALLQCPLRSPGHGSQQTFISYGR